MRRTLAGITLALAAALLTVLPALAYGATAPGASASADTTNSPPGGTAKGTFTFYNPNNGQPLVGDQVTFSFVAPPGCTPQLSASNGVTGPDGKATVSATFPAQCAGMTVQLCSTDATNGSTVCVSVHVQGYPNTASEPRTDNASGSRTSDGTESDGPNYLLIGAAIIGVLIVLGLIVYFVRRRSTDTTTPR